ncbi:unnamed protein product [Sphagnum jensenii]|uniref:Beta-ketoacyl-[acyl-carrier-protein] synthase III C-terminal domain-containing protein n=2 Tax=Sphagnum jensenii TaxID=128206 RepID=A0ABP1A312_9BRYO
MHADGRYATDLCLEHPGSRLKNRITHEMIDSGALLPSMNGKMVFSQAVKYFPEVIREALDANQYTIDDLDLLIPHQANARITAAVQKEFGLPDEKVVSNIHKYGNTTAASLPIAFTEAWEEGRVKEGDLICLAAFGSGFRMGQCADQVVGVRVGGRRDGGMTNLTPITPKPPERGL